MRSPAISFSPERLAEAREARGLSATELADLTGISRQSVSAYERGRQRPSQQTLEMISRQLNLPMDFFLKAPRSSAQSQVFFRSLSAATKRARVRAERRLLWMQDIIDYLSEYLELIDVNLPEFGLRNDPTSLSMDSVEELAMKCRRSWGLGDGPISNVVRLLENKGIIVARQELDTTKLDAYSTFSATGGIPLVVLGSDKDSAVRSRLDAAHELGHLVLHRRIGKLAPYRKIVEQQAFRFAAAFLLPAETFTLDFSVPSVQTFWALKEKWLVSIGAMIKRCEDLGIVSEQRAQRLWMNYTRKGYRKREPFDDILPVEEPAFLAKSIHLLIKEKIQSREDIVRNIGIAPRDIEDLTGLPEGFLTRRDEPAALRPRVRERAGSRSDGERGKVIEFPVNRSDPNR